MSSKNTLADESEKICPSIEDQFAEQQLKDGIFFDDTTKHYKSPIPFRGGKSGAAEILNTRNYHDIALKRTLTAARKMQKDPE